jgi:hypothetical protein
MDVTVLGFLPHMHLRGKSCRYELTTPDKQREVLLDVPRYDFNWQLLYRLAQPRTFKKGSILKFTATFDNSAGNPANPDPAAKVHWGEQTDDEMIVGYVEYFVPVGSGTSSTDGAPPSLTGDREQMLFTALDDNDDDRLSLEELKKLSADPRLKQVGPAAIALAFPSLDQDQDAVLTVDEFRKLRELFRKKR